MFNQRRALEAIEFIQLLKHTGDFYGQPFVLLDWQYETLWDVYGTVKEDGCRQYRTAYLEIPKKNGKTELIAGLALYHLACDPADGQIFCCAADKAQAALTYNAAVAMVNQTPFLKKMLKIKESVKEIINKKTGTKLKVVSAEAYTKHGINPTVVIFDELHCQPNRDLYDVMTFGAGAARREPIWWFITTAGDDPDRTSIGWEVHTLARKIMEGELTDPTWYAKIYSAPEDADIFDEETWRRANPSLGTTIPIEAVRAEALAARNSSSAERLFRWLRLNQWVSNKTTSWLPLTLWDSCVSKLSPADLIGKRCYIGLDLSSIGDLTAAGFVFPPQDGLDKYVVMSEQWIPLDNMKRRINEDKVPYDKWLKDGYIHATAGDVVDYDYVKARLGAVNQLYEVAAWGNDPWGAEKLRQDLDREYDIELIKIRQNIETMSPPMKEIERLLRLGMMEQVHNPVTRWAFGNMSIVVDGNENYKAKKTSRVSRIDPIVAIINAMYLTMKLEEEENKVREVIAI
jgi:phage terminase large subunit-like protein